MLSWIREGFADFKQIKTYFSETLPNIIYNTDTNVDLKALTGTVDVNTKTTSTPLKKEWLKNVGALNVDFKKKQTSCESVGGGDTFDKLASMASSVNTSERVRCGWVYNKTNFENGRGALGSSTGPIQAGVKGDWMWDLNAAKQRYHTDFCKKVQSCADIDASQYKQRCGWCSTSGKAIPIIGGTVAYPIGQATSCSPSAVITSSSSCPKAKAIPADSNYVRTPAELCSPLQSGALPRDCILSKVTSVGCSDKGALFQALKSGSENDYLSAIYNKKAYQTYQERAVIPLNATAVKTGKLAAADALNEFKRVQDQSASEANSGLKVAAYDLCMKAGALDEFDFCSELQDSTKGPFTLDCLQKIFLRMGGQMTGTKYPTQGTIQTWNAMGTWGKVRNAVEAIFANTRSSDRKVQAQAMMDFYGIKLQPGKSGNAGIANVGFVRIVGTGKAGPLNMSQLVVHDENGNNVSKGRPVQSSGSPYSNGLAEMANDGEEKPRPHPYEFHGKGSGTDFWQVHLVDGPKTVTAVTVYNRSDCCLDRMGSGYVIELYSPLPKPSLLWRSEPLNSSLVQKIITAGPIRFDEQTKKCIKAVEETGFVPRVHWGSTPGSEQKAICDDLLCPYFREKYGSLDSVPATYIAEANYCKSK